MERQRRRPGSPVVWIVAAGVAGLLACSAPASAPPAGGGAAPAAQSSAPPAAAANATAAAPGPAATPAQLRHLDLGVVALVSYFYPMWIALEKGFWAQQGLDVEM